MSEVTIIGKLLTGTEQRDAIHIAVAPMIAGERLRPGEDIGLRKGTTNVAILGADKMIGIVDPFLKQLVRRDQSFWMFLYPYTITALRHRWEHPDFPEAPAGAHNITPSGQWLRDFAEQCNLSYGDLMQGAKDWIDHEEFLNRGSLLEGVRVPEEFWEHYENVAGFVDEDKKNNFFTCSC